MDNSFQNTLPKSLQNVPKWLEFTKTSRYKRLQYLTKDGWGGTVFSKWAGVTILGVAVSAFWLSLGWVLLSFIGVLFFTFAIETLLQNTMKKSFAAHNIQYHDNCFSVATASYKLKVLEACKKAQATSEQMEDLQKLALTDDAPQGWWEFVFKQAKETIEKENQHRLLVEKSQQEQQALVQIQQIIDPVVSIEKDTQSTVKHKTLQL